MGKSKCEDKTGARKSNNPGVGFVNFGHSKQKTFNTSKSSEDADYAKVLTKGHRRKGNNPEQKASSVLDADECCMADLMDCLDSN